MPVVSKQMVTRTYQEEEVTLTLDKEEMAVIQAILHYTRLGTSGNANIAANILIAIDEILGEEDGPVIGVEFYKSDDEGNTIYLGDEFGIELEETDGVHE